MKMLRIFLVFAVTIAHLHTQAQVLINEFLADNVVTNTDPNGEFNDWIELYNAGDLAVDLAGYCLSDNPMMPCKFRITSDSATLTTIPPHGFLLIWADEQPYQGGLHTNFRLAASGEFISLSNSVGALIDHITFSAQYPDISWGRSADAGPDWTQQSPPSPNGSNALVAIEPTQYAKTFSLYPNPAQNDVRSTDGQPFELLNAHGQIIEISNKNGIANVSGLQAGTYIARTLTGHAARLMKR